MNKNIMPVLHIIHSLSRKPIPQNPTNKVPKSIKKTIEPNLQFPRTPTTEQPQNHHRLNILLYIHSQEDILQALPISPRNCEQAFVLYEIAA